MRAWLALFLSAPILQLHILLLELFLGAETRQSRVIEGLRVRWYSLNVRTKSTLDVIG